MPTTLDLINSEKFASLIFIISSCLSLVSACEAERYELEKQLGIPSSDIKTSAASSTKFGLDSTLTALLAYLIFIIVAVIRKNQLEQQISSGSTKTSTLPNVLIISGFIVSIIGNIIRIPAILQRLEEAQRPVIL